MVDNVDNIYWGLGRRKSAVARVRLKKGNGKIELNLRNMDEYFVNDGDRVTVHAPLKMTKTFGKYDVFVNVKGGGASGQAGAVALGIARALQKADESCIVTLKSHNLLTRDSRMKERKKYGQKGARKGFQWTKR